MSSLFGEVFGVRNTEEVLDKSLAVVFVSDWIMSVWASVLLVVPTSFTVK